MEKQGYVRIKRGVHRIATIGPITIAIDRVSQERALIFESPIGPIPVPISNSDYRRLGLEIIQEHGTSYDFHEEMPEPEAQEPMRPAEPGKDFMADLQSAVEKGSDMLPAEASEPEQGPVPDLQPAAGPDPEMGDSSDPFVHAQADMDLPPEANKDAPTEWHPMSGPKYKMPPESD